MATKNKLALFCHVPAAHCLGVHDLSNIYRVPMLLHAQVRRPPNESAPRVGAYARPLRWLPE